MKSGKLGCYLLERVNVWKAGHIPVRQYYTLVGTTDHVMDAILDQATERLKTEMENILCQFEDPAPVIDCVLAYHFMEQQSPRVLYDEDRKAIDNMFETLKRFYEEDLKTGAYKQAFKSGYTDQQFEEDFKDLPDEIRYEILVEGRAEGVVSKAIGFQRYAAWQIKPEKRPGRRTGLERIRTWYKPNPKYKKAQPLIVLQLTGDGFVSSFEYDILMAQALACELASISRHQSRNEKSKWANTHEANRRAKRGQPRDHLCEPLFQWVFGNVPEKYSDFRERAEKMDWYYTSDIHNPDLANVCGPQTSLRSIYRIP